MTVRDAWGLVRDTGQGWMNHQTPRLSAALAFYAMLSLAPLLTLVTAVAGLVFGEVAVRERLADQIRALVGPEGAGMVRVLLADADLPGAALFASITSLLVLLLGAAGVFVELQEALNTIGHGGAPVPGRGLLGALKGRLFSALLVLATGLLLLVSLGVSAALAALGDLVGGVWPDLVPAVRAVGSVVSLAVVTLLFAVVYKVLPNVRLPWTDVWVGAVTTALLFTAGKVLIGMYLGTSSIRTAYGATGSLAVFLVWVYYSAHVLFIGAEFTYAYARWHRSHAGPGTNASPAL
jgi:membrane protein